MKSLLPVLALIVIACWNASPADPSLDGAFGAMNRSAASFKGMEGTIRQTDYTALIKLSDVQTGRIIVRRAKPTQLQIRMSFDAPNEKQVEITSTRVRIYLPKANTVQEKPLSGKMSSMAQQLFLLGFGTTSKQLQAGYAVLADGQEVLAGEKTFRLLLTPKSAEVASQFPHIELWMSAASGLPQQQKVDEPGHDYHLLTYSNLKIRQDIKASEVELQLPKNVRHERL